MPTRLTPTVEPILAANCIDLEEGQNNGLSEALLDRMSLQKRLPGIADDVRNVAALPDPVGKTFDERTLENGLQVCRRRTPLGVLGVIYEARPNVTVDVVALALKTGNAVIMRGGKEILRSNMALVKVIRQALRRRADLTQIIPADAIQYIESTDRRYVDEMLKLHQYIDMIIPRGGAALHQHCRENSTIPVITGGLGICHVFVDRHRQAGRCARHRLQRQDAAPFGLQFARYACWFTSRSRRSFCRAWSISWARRA